MFLFYPITKTNLRNKTIFKTYVTQEYYYLNHIYKTLTYAMLQITKPLQKKNTTI